MLSASRAFRQSSSSAPEFPRVPALRDVYDRLGWRPREGGITMIAGIPGGGKSMFTTFWVASMGIPALYFAADTSPYDASMRLATMALREPVEEIEARLQGGEDDQVVAALRGAKINFSFGAPLTWQGIEEELDAWVELRNDYPKIVVLDNLMDFGGGDSDYTAQMAIMSDVTAFARKTGIHVVVLHHATDKGFNDPRMPPPRSAIKNGLAEKPEQVLTVAGDPESKIFRVAKVKDRSGKPDPSGETYATLRAIPGIASFAPMES